MPLFKSTKPRYAALEEGEELKLGGYEDACPQYVTVRLGFCSSLAVLCMLFATVASTWVLFFSSVLSPVAPGVTAPVRPASQWVCQQPATRREWRTLSEGERVAYTDAVRCLATKPSKLGISGTLYDDFPWVHKHKSADTHKAAPFLPWHRQFIHLYEKALKEECSFDGVLPYWDWSMDWNNFAGSPVWSETSGLGGDGDATSPVTVGDGRCVTAGPFAGLSARWYDGAEHPHCLSRGFASSKELAELGNLVEPQAIEALMAEDDYAAFEEQLEHRAHNFLSRSVKGDLSRFTGPNDPVFWLHHTNIDRLWAEWQLKNEGGRVWSYGGLARNASGVPASMEDAMEFAGLGRTMPVGAVMETNNGHFCYGY